MREGIACGSCGAQLPYGARSCPSCGAARASGGETEVIPSAAATDETEIVSPAPTEVQPAPPTSDQAPAPPPPVDPPAPPPPADGPPPPGLAPGQSAASERRAPSPLPGVMLAAAAAVTTALVTFIVSLALALLLSDASFTRPVLFGGSEIKGAFRGAVSMTQAQVYADGFDAGFRFLPLTFTLLLVGTAMASVRILTGALSGVREMAARSRLLWGAATGVPLAALFTVFALISKEDAFDTTYSFSILAVILLTLLWGAIGGAAGAALSLRRDGRLGDLGLSAGLTTALRVLAAALKPLAALLLAFAVVGSAVWVVQTARDGDELKSEAALYANGAQQTPSTGTLILDEVLFLGDHGVHFAELGSGAQFRTPAYYEHLGLPAPVAKAREVFDADAFDRFSAGVGVDEEDPTPEGSFRLLDYKDALSTPLFIASLGLILIVAMAAAFAGFRAAGAAGAGSSVARAASGAVVGPVWGACMLGIDAIVQKDVFGRAITGNVGLMFLLGGAALGALGGLASARWPSSPAATGPAAATSPAPPPPPPPA